MRILVKFPTRNRPHKFLQVFRQLIETANDIQVLVTFDNDDPTMTHEIKIAATEIDNRMALVGGLSKNKIHACNRDIILDAPYHWDILVLMSDDMIPQQEGWDDIIRYDMKTQFPDLDGVLWYSDGYQDRICTMSIMGRKYYERFGYIYHPSYTSLWCDNEFTEVALNLNKMYKSDTCLFKHEHPMNNQRVATDALYKRNEPFYHIDEKVYNERKANNFPI